MHQKLMSSLANYGDSRNPSPLASPDQYPCLTNGGDYLGVQPSQIFSIWPDAVQPTQHSPTSSSPSLDEDDGSTLNRINLASFALQYQEMADRYIVCLGHFQDAAEEADALREENAHLRLTNAELNKRLGLVSGRVAPSKASILNGLGRVQLCGNSSPAQTSPRSVLGMQDHRFSRRGVDERISVPKSISIRSNGYLKLNAGGSRSTTNRNSRLRVATPVTVGSMVRQQSMYVGSNSKDGAEEALEFDVFNQGMFKTELCNKWEESGDCPYGDQCQFAHGIGELRPIIRHPRYKTELCRMVLAGEPCPYGHRCHFRHVISPNDRSLLRPT